MQKALVEALGTFFLVLVIGLTGLSGVGPLAPLAIGGILIAMIYAGGPVSGAHYNPAVTLAALIAGKCPAKNAVPYISAQLSGALAASMLVTFIKGATPTVILQPQPLPALLIELVFTFALAYVVLNVATTRKATGNSYYGLAIGLTIVAAAYAGGGISGGAFNPAVAVGLSLMGTLSPASLWIFFAADLAGAALAALVFRTINPDG